VAFFAGTPLPVQFFLTFVIVFGLIGVTAWAARSGAGGWAVRCAGSRGPW
jgi:hypothetical protein